MFFFIKWFFFIDTRAHAKNRGMWLKGGKQEKKTVKKYYNGEQIISLVIVFVCETTKPIKLIITGMLWAS